MHRFVGILGILFILGMSFLFSTNRRAIRYKTVAWGLGLQIAFAFLVMRWEYGQRLFEKLGAGANWLLDFSYYGSSFVFGDLGRKNSPMGFYFAFQALPIIIFIAAFFAVLYYCGIMQVIVKAAARVMTSLMGASGAESLNVAASIFMGQTEAPLDHPSVPPGCDPFRTDDHYDQRDGTRFRQLDGRLRRLRNSTRTPDRCRDHDGSWHDPDRKSLCARDRKTIHRRKSARWRISNAIPMLSAPSPAAPMDGLHLALNVAAMLISFIALIYLRRRLLRRCT